MPAVRAPDPPNEPRRLAALRGYAILDTEPDEDFDSTAEVQRGYEAGADDQIRKPFGSQELRARIQAIRGRR